MDELDLTRVVDAHTHVLNEQIWADYCAKTPKHQGAVLCFQNWAQRSGPPKYPIEKLVEFTGQHPRLRLVACVNLYQYSNPYMRELGRLLADGKITALKLLLGYQHFNAASAEVDRVAKFARDFKVPLILHTGDCSTQYGDPLVEYAHPLHVDRLAMANRDTTIVMAHLGFPWLMDGAMVVNKHPNVYADISGTIDACTGVDAAENRMRLIRRYRKKLTEAVDFYPVLAQRLMFGTDYSGEHTHLTEINGYMDVACAIFGDRRDELAAVLYRTAERVFSLN